MPRIHNCPTCGHVVQASNPTPIAVEHLPDGRHTWSVVIKVGLSFGGKRAE